MNRKKKINQTLKAKAKKMNAKRQKSNKPKYISKAERAAMAVQQAQDNADNLATAKADLANQAAQTDLVKD
ncbi:Protein of unknown function [Colwellia chukchiensis]|uniref:DUF2986 domain-containing protein n=1 Tax=Colwellia chukchiensis TaxID=641665 RepID=A0A1H7KM50_9GAMM|nr:DUF2986 domain-containing protein [Colwellia chukchiensis]SEK87610.1 Protein of unknown function [Colwellia chukchiensis]